MSINAIDRIYNSLIGEDEYGDFPETEAARRKLKAYAMSNLLSEDDEEMHRQWLELEKIVSEFGMVSGQQKRNTLRLREDMKMRYFDAPDLADVGKNGYRFVNAVSDFATHAKPLRERSNSKESLFARTVDGNPMIDRAYQMVAAA